MTVRDVVYKIKGVKFVIINTDDGDLLHSIGNQYFYTLERPVLDLKVREVEITAYRGMCAIVTLAKADSRKEKYRIKPQEEEKWKDVV